MTDSVIITAALTGTSTPLSLNENIPHTSERIAEDAYQAWKAERQNSQWKLKSN